MMFDGGIFFEVWFLIVYVVRIMECLEYFVFVEYFFCWFVVVNLFGGINRIKFIFFMYESGNV